MAEHLGTLENKSVRTGPDTGVVTPGHGRIRQGAAADFVLLDANPLENIANTSRIAGVMIGGRWIPRAEIDRRLAGMRAR